MRKQQGAVLLAVMVVALILTLLLSAAHIALSKRLELATKMDTFLSGKVASYTQIQHLTYLAATQRITRVRISAGTNAAGKVKIDGVYSMPFAGDEIRADGFDYDISIDGVTVKYRIQAVNGLLPINSAEPTWLKKWLLKKGYNEFEANKLLDSLADYADADDWIRPAGAEKQQYKRAQMTEPVNYLLQQPSELTKIVHWQEIVERYPEIINLSSVKRSSEINFNAIPIALWQQLWPESADKVQTLRHNNRWFVRKDDVKLWVPELAHVAEPFYTVFPRSQFILEVESAGARRIHRLRIGDKSNVPYKDYLRVAE